jgi:CHAT domain-containing protein
VLPLDALRPDPDSEPLASRYEIVLTPSATAWMRLKRTPPRQAPKSALALADPALPGEAAVFRQAAPWSEAIRLGPLPKAREEGRDLVSRLGRGSVFRAGEEASEQFLKHSDIQEFSILHLAAHAVADDERPDRSAVLLAPGAPEQDGLLQLREVVGLDLGGTIVILSACGTASGEQVRGEGVLGLGRAFLQAGARTVIGSLWPLRDDEAAVLVGQLARHLARGESVGAAMTAARRERIAAGDPVTAWAGLVVLGDGDVVPVRGGNHGAAVDWRRPGLLLVLAALAAGLALLLYRWRRSH